MSYLSSVGLFTCAGFTLWWRLKTWRASRAPRRSPRARPRKRGVMARAVCGVLEYPPAAHTAVQDLLDSGFLRENISVVAREGSEGAGDPGSTPPPAAPPSGAS